jgi:hypothetical protein
LNIQECVQTAARIQILLRDLHTGLARCFATNRTLRENFLDLAREEAQRALDIRLLVLDRRGVPWSDEAIDTIRQDLVSVVAVLSAMAGELHRDSGSFSPVSVLRRIIHVERRRNAIHAGSLSRCADPELRRFFSSLTRRDRRVEQLLEQALRSQVAPVHAPSVTARKVAANLAA